MLSPCLMLAGAALAALCLAGPPATNPVREGEPIPNFALPSVDGKKTVHLSDFRGKKVILFAWACQQPRD